MFDGTSDLPSRFRANVKAIAQAVPSSVKSHWRSVAVRPQAAERRGGDRGMKRGIRCDVGITEGYLILAVECWNEYVSLTFEWRLVSENSPVRALSSSDDCGSRPKNTPLSALSSWIGGKSQYVRRPSRSIVAAGIRAVDIAQVRQSDMRVKYEARINVFRQL